MVNGSWLMEMVDGCFATDAVDEYEWHVEPRGAMRVPGVLYADERLVREMDDKVTRFHVATLPGT